MKSKVYFNEIKPREKNPRGFLLYAIISSSSDLENISLSVSGEEVATNLIEVFMFKRNASSLCILLAVNAP